MCHQLKQHTVTVNKSIYKQTSYVARKKIYITDLCAFCYCYKDFVLSFIQSVSCDDDVLSDCYIVHVGSGR